MESLISSLIGTLIGGVLALIGVYYGHKLQLSQKERQDQQMINGFLQAILTELDTCWERARDTVNPYIEELSEGIPFAVDVSIKTDFFTVYHNNSQLLGRVNDDHLRNLIVATYTRYKALVESYNVNTELLRDWRQSRHMCAVTTEEDLSKYYFDKAQNEYIQLVVFAKLLKTDHLLLKEQINDLLPALRKAVNEVPRT